jgi:hypothetical protein
VTPGTEVYIESSGSVSEVTGSSPGYIVEGSSFEGQIRHTNDTIEVTDDANLGTPRINKQLGVNTQPSQQTWLENTAGNTTTTTDELWKNFPEGGTFFGSPNPDKDPLSNFLDNFGVS